MSMLERPECFRCGKTLAPGDWRYRFLPWEQYCSMKCLEESIPHIAEAIRSWNRAHAREAQPRSP